MTIRSVTGRRVTALSAGWQLGVAAPGTEPKEWTAAIVPGTAAQALQAAGRYSLDAPAKLHDKDVWYRTRFAGAGSRTLRFGGLATIADVWLNGTRILSSNNMFLAHEVDVELAGDNDLVMRFASLDKALDAKKGRARWRTRLVENNALRHVRTTLLGHMTGWQPAVHAVGPWQAVELIEQAPQFRVRGIDLRVSLEGDDGVVNLSLDIEREGMRPPAILYVGQASGPLTWAGNNRVAGTVRVAKVEKWWPATHGTPALHRVRLRLGDIEIDLGQTGFRRLTIDRGADGKGFSLTVNGQRIFARGACWSASDLVSLAGDRAGLAPWLEQARAAHMNMVRVGGTMTYASEDFLALCDELGLLVWHDFMFANMDYPIGDESFRAGVDAEVRQFLARSQGHPSLAVLCGGSEVAQQAAMLGLPRELWTSPLYEELLPQAVKAVRPDVPYVPHSPWQGDLPFATDSGVSHYYGVGAYLRPLEDARRADVRFTSECLGFANVPAAASAGVPWNDAAKWKAAVPRDRGAEWDFEDVRNHYVRLLYGDGPDRDLRRARAAPAEAMEATIAEWRRAGSGCAGALVWMLKDFVPGAGWGLIDSNGLPKLAWHALRRVFRPVQVSLTDEGLNGLGIHLTNDTAALVRTRLSLVCLRDGTTITLKREREAEMPARSAQTLSSAELIGAFFDVTYAYRFGPPPLDAAIVTLDEVATGARLAEAIHFPLGRGLAHDPGLAVELKRQGGDWFLHLRAERLAACIQVEDRHYYGDDEGFFLLPGEERAMKLLPAGGATAPPSGRVLAGYDGYAVGYG
ncbi:MAG TPA: glycoside hydrolase family 2 protein [Reyranella sp.]|nr:glycoside hydrolase family 2 protein [Reyranella sp.]